MRMETDGGTSFKIKIMHCFDMSWFGKYDKIPFTAFQEVLDKVAIVDSTIGWANLFRNHN